MQAAPATAAPAPAVASAAAGAPVSSSWTAMEVASLVTTGVLVIVVWLVFRKLKFPE